MTNKIYGYIFTLVFASSAMGAPISSEEENNGEVTGNQQEEVPPTTEETPTPTEESDPSVPEPDVTIDEPVSGEDLQENLLEIQPPVSNKPINNSPEPAAESNPEEVPNPPVVEQIVIPEPAATNEPPVEAPSQEKIEPEAICQPISFNAKGWVSAANHNATDYPIIVGRKIEELILLPDDRYSAATAAIYANTVTPPFEVQFEFNTFDDDGGYNGSQVWHSADGISFFFLKDGTRYGTPPNGGKMGQSKKGGGLAVSFPMYGSRQVRLSETGGRTLTQRYFRNAYSHGKWIPVSVTVKADGVTVKSEDKNLFTYPLDLKNFQHGNSIGFSAATGAADARQEVRGLCIKKL